MAQALMEGIPLLFLDVELGRPLLEQDDIFPDESGNGYALRMLGRNGLAFSDLASVVASPGHRYLPAGASGRIAYLFGSRTGEVLHAIPQVYQERGRLKTSFMGHVIGRPYHMRHTRPQFCPRCLGEKGRALALWDISLVTACPEHGCLLQDACQRCDRKLSWRRPALRACYCDFDLADGMPVVAHRDEVWLSRCIRDALFRMPGDSERTSYALLQRLSLDCLLRLIRALGMAEASDGSDLQPGRVTRVLTSVDASGVVRRAMARFRALSGQMDDVKTAVHSIWDLRGLLDDVGEADWTLMHELLNRIAAIEGISYAHSVRHQQLSLFEGVK
ncbi:MAG: hypothetical protein EPN62_14470 [Candidimonas sp.]|nr:MAG: hypothetical protein EPN77_03840 [Candidimonas sp.]TAM21281.1 MAG: hypothetical protein EPN62_14470 [Candidimonas sp.]